MASVEFFGESFGLRPKISQYALAKFGQVAAKGEKAGAGGIGAILDLLEKCVAPEDWERFDQVASDNDASFEDINVILDAAFHQETERPTSLPADSSDGQKIIAPSVASSSVDKGLDRLRGRPDLQLAVLHTRSA